MTLAIRPHAWPRPVYPLVALSVMWLLLLICYLLIFRLGGRYDALYHGSPVGLAMIPAVVVAFFVLRRFRTLPVAAVDEQRPQEIAFFEPSILLRGRLAPERSYVSLTMTCIFCRETADESRVEHILPESLGGGDWACVPRGIVCAKCNQYFGAKVEGKALNSFPFLAFRLLLGIPTKKGKAPFVKTRLGTLRSGAESGTLGLDPFSEEMLRQVADGEVTQVRLIAEPTEPQAVCRLLLKMGLEVIACDSPTDAYSARYDAARRFARSPQPNQEWWFLLACDHEQRFKRFRSGVSASEWMMGVSLSIAEQDGFELFHLRLLEMEFIIPLEPVFEPGPDLHMKEPEWRLFEVSGATRG